MNKVFYHGTDAAYKDAILRDGLIPAKSPGADHWAAGVGYARGLALNPKATNRAPSIFLTEWLDHAATFSQYSAIGNKHASGVLFRVTIPETHQHLLKKDEIDSIAFRFEGPIPSAWLHLVEEFPARTGTKAASYGRDLFDDDGYGINDLNNIFRAFSAAQ